MRAGDVIPQSTPEAIITGAKPSRTLVKGRVTGFKKTRVKPQFMAPPWEQGLCSLSNLLSSETLVNPILLNAGSPKHTHPLSPGVEGRGGSKRRFGRESHCTPTPSLEGAGKGRGAMVSPGSLQPSHPHMCTDMARNRPSWTPPGRAHGLRRKLQGLGAGSTHSPKQL